MKEEREQINPLVIKQEINEFNELFTDLKQKV